MTHEEFMKEKAKLDRMQSLLNMYAYEVNPNSCSDPEIRQKAINARIAEIDRRNGRPKHAEAVRTASGMRYKY